MAILNQQVKDKVQKSILPTKKPTPVLGKVTPPALSFHHPDASEGAGMWELVKETGVLDLNSSYLYLMMGRYYGQTCLVAKQNGKVRGFVMGFIPPERDDTYFLWQVGVSAAARGQGLATRMIQHLLKQPACKNVRYLETTITPSNEASRKLFKGLARRWDAELKIQTGFDASLFPGHAAHESEDLFYIGPFDLHAEKGVKA